MPHEDKNYDGSLVLEFRKAVTPHENDLLLLSIDKVSADQYHVTILRAQV